MTEMQERQSVVAEARKWLLTPYRHAADIRGVGVDCGMFIVRVFRRSRPHAALRPASLRARLDDPSQRRKIPRLLQPPLWRVQARSQATSPCSAMAAAIRTAASSRRPIRLAIIHAYHDAGCVVEERLSQNPALTDPRRKLAWFSIWAEPEF